jgi:hypothetical protein
MVGQTGGTPVRTYTLQQRRNKAKNSMLSKETYLQANFRFIVSPLANSLEAGFYDPDQLV